MDSVKQTKLEGNKIKLSSLSLSLSFSLFRRMASLLFFFFFRVFSHFFFICSFNGSQIIPCFYYVLSYRCLDCESLCITTYMTTNPTLLGIHHEAPANLSKRFTFHLQEMLRYILVLSSATNRRLRAFQFRFSVSVNQYHGFCFHLFLSRSSDFVCPMESK